MPTPVPKAPPAPVKAAAPKPPPKKKLPPPLAPSTLQKLRERLEAERDRHLRQADELAWFAKDDLAPFGLMCLRMGWRALTRPLARRGTRRPTTTPQPLAARRTPA